MCSIKSLSQRYGDFSYLIIPLSIKCLRSNLRPYVEFDLFSSLNFQASASSLYRGLVEAVRSKLISFRDSEFADRAIPTPLFAPTARAVLRQPNPSRLPTRGSTAVMHRAATVIQHNATTMGTTTA
jgi:hypothetical protein